MGEHAAVYVGNLLYKSGGDIFDTRAGKGNGDIFETRDGKGNGYRVAIIVITDPATHERSVFWIKARQPLAWDIWAIWNE